MKRKRYRRILITWYGPRGIFWFVRLNLVLFRDLHRLEFTFGILGFGLLANLRYGRDVRDLGNLCSTHSTS